MSLRLLLTDRSQYTQDRLRDNEINIERAYGSEGVTVVDTRGLTISDVANRIAEIVHLGEYEPVCDLHARLEYIQEEGYNGTV